MNANKRYTSTGYCNVWGSKLGARRVFGLTRDERSIIRDGGQINLADCPVIRGITDRVIVARGKSFYTRMP